MKNRNLSRRDFLCNTGIAGIASVGLGGGVIGGSKAEAAGRQAIGRAVGASAKVALRRPLSVEPASDVC